MTVSEMAVSASRWRIMNQCHVNELRREVYYQIQSSDMQYTPFCFVLLLVPRPKASVTLERGPIITNSIEAQNNFDNTTQGRVKSSLVKSELFISSGYINNRHKNVSIFHQVLRDYKLR